MLYYADDIVVYVKSGSLRVSFDRLQEAFTHFRVALAEIGLELSCAKSKVCIFGDKGKIRDLNLIKKHNLNITFNGEVVSIVESIKFLGVFFDRKMTWIEHAKYLNKICEKRYNVIKSISGIK